ncbi:hypothetical protein K458DRAFT_390280 [Lentithecium fluviatile CBS 122367]|uniref:F-box domain-containing protein n=1 Tax=Lentithecium fluviatile CBS 122367 TaxID=1168545 RepID=A0A6G1IYI3_9PLEO|nr:hypothetical protein K458DRAFT_390280 [Lentithecium fluviatile CBS 122367]
MPGYTRLVRLGKWSLRRPTCLLANLIATPTTITRNPTKSSVIMQTIVLDYAACHAVLETPELLENILSCLDIRSLLTKAQRVSRRWNATITSSKKLQRLLFFQPELPKPQNDESVENVHNPLLTGIFNPWYAKHFNWRTIAALPMAECIEWKEAVMRPKASWRRMLVSQPPAKKVGCWRTVYSTSGELPGEDAWQFRVQSFPKGLRMGKLYDITQRFVGDNSRPACAVYWKPYDPTTLTQFFWPSHMASRDRTEARDKCVAAVDIILMGERWVSGGNLTKRQLRELAQFRRDFKLKSLTGAEVLGPPSNELFVNKYKTVVQFAADLDAAKSASS